MCKLTLTAGLCLIIASLASSSRLVCYYNSLAENRAEDGRFTVSDIDPNQCTHLIYAFSDINNQHQLVPSSETDIQRYQSFTGLKTRNPLLKTLLAVGGLTFDTTKYLDFINVLTFDFHGPWESVTGHHSPLYRGSRDTGDKIYSNTDSAMKYWRDKGAPSQKLNLGLAAYGRVFTLSSAFSNVGAPASGPGKEGHFTGEEGFWASYETCLYVRKSTIHLIPDQRVPYAKTKDQWVGFDNNTSLDIKVSYLKNNNFGGAFVWSLDLDDFNGQFCKQGNYPFISNLHKLLVPDFPGLTTPTPTTTTPTTPTKVSTGNPCDGKSDGVYTNPDDPNSFYNCAGQITYIQKCQPGLIFKQSCKCCDWPTTTTPTKVPTGNPCDGKSDGVYTNPDDPNSFYNCAGQITYIQKCQPGLIFKQSCKCCDWP
ncbi:chitotriosidase-1-like isoform X4 [Siniperca chuatsi]|uniref:chitotriosidase-1-like isoform X4 n=1 Tax=Siniperca chuatsi TaxID=119488 RepID=UPI001CE05BDA|nr:chitotriosidase-1-like isoform X4 [Siniperca chuatsi]